MAEGKLEISPTPWGTATVIRNGRIFAAVIDVHCERLCTMPDYGAAAQANAVMMSCGPEMYARLEQCADDYEAMGMFENRDRILELLAKVRGEEAK